MGNLIGLWWYVLSKHPWRRTFLSPPTSLCWDVHGTNNSHLKKDRAITLVQPESTRRPSQPAWCCQDFVKFGCFVGCEAEDTHPERGYKSWDTHSKRPLFTVGPIVSVWMMLPQNTPGAAWERKETHVVRPDPLATSPRVAISGSIHSSLPFCPHAGSRRANTQTTSTGVFSEWGSILWHKETSGRRGRWLPGERWGEPGLCLGPGLKWNSPRSGFHDSDQRKSTHSQLSGGDLNLYSVRREKTLLAVSPS